ncbi:MAG: M1 family metallopeptidase [Gammaproteobacteria bacterium]
MKTNVVKFFLHGPRWNRIATIGMGLFLLVLILFIPNSAVFGSSYEDRSMDAGAYNPRAVFDPEFLQITSTAYRAASGVPGLTYWQNRADYKINARLDVAKNLLIGRVEITYTNNSPDKLDYLWLQLDQNLYRSDSRGAMTIPYGDPRSSRVTEGIRLSGVYITENNRLMRAPYFINDTNMRIDLPSGLTPHGGKIRLVIDYSFDISNVYDGPYATRMGRMSTPDGPIYAIAQWYPRMVVYDDITGWNTLPYRGLGEFYLEYGDFDYSINVPWNYIVVGSGRLVNPNTVLTPEQISRLHAAVKSDQTIHIRSAAEVGDPASRPVQSGRLIWHFKINNARDAVWAASPAYVWDAARINLQGGKYALAMAVYPRDVASVPGVWNYAVQDLKWNLEFFSRKFGNYPYPTATAVAAPVLGMEYPSVVFISSNLKLGYVLFHDVTHEIGHTWFPMIVGSNERRYTWMDEGFDFFINEQAWDTHQGGPNMAGLDSKYAKDIVEIMSKEIDPIMTDSDDILDYDIYNLEYRKTAFGLALLRNYILDENDFDHAFNAYIQAWAYKHPTPYDFFRLMNNETGENLDWFWKEWFFENWKLDQAVVNVNYFDKDPRKGSLITIENKDQMVMPAIVEVEECNGKQQVIKFPVEIWADGSTWKFKVNTGSKLKSVIIDPNNLLPDENRKNNTWTSKC